MNTAGSGAHPVLAGRHRSSVPSAMLSDVNAEGDDASRTFADTIHLSNIGGISG